VMGKNVSARLMLEVDSTRWGAPPTGTLNNMRDANNFGYWSTDRSALEVKYVYFDVGLPYFGIPFPMNVRLGAQPMAIRPWFYAATDGTGVSGSIKIDPVNLNPFYFKPKQGSDWAETGVDIYGLQANAKVGTLTIGGYGVYYNMNSYPMWVASSLGANNPNAMFSAVAPQINGTYSANFWYLGLYADGKAGPVDLQFDAAYEWGRVITRGQDVAASSVPYAGWAARLKVDFPWEKFNFGAIGMYGSGSDANRSSATGLPGTNAADGTPSTRVSGWMVPVGSEQGAVNAESVVVYGTDAGASGGAGWAVNHNYNQMSKGAFGGSWFAKAYGSYKIAPWYKVTLQGLYIGDTTLHGNTYGTAHKYPGVRTGPAANLLRDDSSIGVELDFRSTRISRGGLWAATSLQEALRIFIILPLAKTGQ
jgi:hypothetical protein